jgi:ribulose-5-phosphate 4-epimerase/fuculose-1-phosphate aldolase
MLACMADRPVCILRGHGVSVCGETLEQAVVRTLNINELAVATLAAAGTRRDLPDIAAEDIAELPTSARLSTTLRYGVTTVPRLLVRACKP